MTFPLGRLGARLARLSVTCLAAAMCLMAPAGAQERVRITGEVIDTWCYFSGVMGPPEATLGTAHHTCALWCSAGGIPVGILSDDGRVYQVVKVGADDTSASSGTLLRIASHEVVAEGIHHHRDGLDYLLVERIVEDRGITNVTHDEWGFTPPFAVPKGER